MEDYKRSQRIGAAAICCALIFRAWSMNLPGKLRQWLTGPDLAAFSIYAETSRDIRDTLSRRISSFFPPESSPPWSPAGPEQEPTLPTYTGEVEVLNYGEVEVDFAALLEKPLTWNLLDGEPAVLILHTHTTESYTRGDEPYEEVSDWRTLDEGYNMLSIGDAVAEILEEAGIKVIHDRTVHDYPSYASSYDRARETLQGRLEEYPTVRLVLDLHRDAAETSSGDQYRTLANVDGTECAQLMPVIGSGFAGFEENLSLALKLMSQLERQAPGITRHLLVGRSGFNQDLCPGAVLVEVGSAGNSHAEAILAAKQLANAILALAGGTAAGDGGE